MSSAVLISEPKQRLSKDMIKVWLIRGLIEDAIGFVILAGLFYLDHRFSWKEWVGTILVALFGICVLSVIWTFIRPFLQYKNWRYDVNEEYLQLKFGAITEEHHLIPMTKIQSVATEQGPILRIFNLRSVTVVTMGSSHQIPALPDSIARELRDKIAAYARIEEV